MYIIYIYNSYIYIDIYSYIDIFIYRYTYYEFLYKHANTCKYIFVYV